MEYLLIIGCVGLFFVLMSLRIILKKGGEFKGTCASQNPFLQEEGGSCSYCGKEVNANTACEKDLKNS